MIKDFRKTKQVQKIKNGQFSFSYILQLPHTVISNSEKLTHPIVPVLYSQSDLPPLRSPCGPPGRDLNP